MSNAHVDVTNESQEHASFTSENLKQQTSNPPSDSLNPENCQLNSVAAGDLPDMIPVRMLNEFTYCPRLGYLEWVEGEWASNLETMEGSFGHRRVDQAPKRATRKTESQQPKLPESPTRDTHPTNAPPGDKDPCVSENDVEKPHTENQTSIHARSLMLSAPTEGLLAKLDLLETEGMVTTPVDYKRGKAPSIPEGAYEPERIQLCAQGLILRANGFQCDRGVLYFIGSKKRVTIEFTDELVQRTRQLRDEFRRTAAAGITPPPLVDSPKCPRCSLVGICLPDETYLLQCGSPLRGEITSEREISRVGDTGHNGRARGGDTGHIDEPPVRKLLPANDDALPLYVQTQGAMLGKSGDRLAIRLKDELLAERRLMDVSQVSLFGNVMISAQVLRELTTRGIPVCHFTYGGWFHAITTGLEHKNVELRIRQFEIAADPEKSLRIARWLISGKIRNCRTMLRRHLPDDNVARVSDAGVTAPNDAGLPSTATAWPFPETQRCQELPRRRHGQHCSSTVPGENFPDDSSENLKPKSDRPLDALAEYRRRAERASSAETLLGLEGMAAKTYFQAFFDALNGRHGFDVNDRNRRPPSDPVNAVLSFVYSLLVKELTVVLQAVGFDPMLGFFHRPRYGRPSLALDVAEEYRPLIGDSVTLMVFNNGEVDHSSFLERMGSVTMTESGRKSVIAAFERRLEQEVTHPIFGYRVSYRRILEVQARLLARTVTGELPEYIPFCTR